MEENEKAEDLIKLEKEKKKKDEKELPYCTIAPSAEHTRASDEDEPCDDGRSGDVEQ